MSIQTQTPIQTRTQSEADCEMRLRLIPGVAGVVVSPDEHLVTVVTTDSFHEGDRPVVVDVAISQWTGWRIELERRG